MPEFYCQLCDYTTTRKSSYNNHLVSSKHKAKCSGDDDSDCSSVSNNSQSTELKMKEMELIIKEMEQQMKIKELESQLYIQQLQTQMQYQINNTQLLKIQQLETSQSNPIQLSITEKKDKKKCILDMLNNRNSMTIEHFQDQCLNDEELNPYIQSVQTNDGVFIFPKYISVNDYSKYIPVDVICKTLRHIPIDERPIYCSDVRRRHFYIKTENGWLKPTDKETNTTIENLYWKAFKVIQGSFQKLLAQQSKYRKLIETLYKVNNTNDRAQTGINKIFLEMCITKDDRPSHFSKLKTKLSELTDNDDYVIDKKDKINNVESDTDVDEYDAENDSM